MTSGRSNFCRYPSLPLSKLNDDGDVRGGDDGDRNECEELLQNY